MSADPRKKSCTVRLPESPLGSAEALRRFIAGQRAAAQAALEAAVLLPPEASVRAAMDLWNLRPDLFDAPRDAVRLREDEQVRAAWAKLRERWGR